MNPQKPTKGHLRYMLLTFYDIGLSVTSALHQINNTYGEKTISDDTIRFWYSRFKDGKRSIKDLPRSGRKKKISNAQLENYINNHKDTKLRQLSFKLNYSISTLSTRMNELGLVNKKSTIIPYELTIMNRLDRIVFSETLLEYEKEFKFTNSTITEDETWIYYNNITRKSYWVKKGEAAPKQPAIDFNMKKTMLLVWFDKYGIVYFEYKNDNETINENRYAETILNMHANLKNVRPFYFVYPSILSENRKTTQMFYHHDNATCHKSLGVQHILKTFEFELVLQPSNSPDLAPADFHLFKHMKQKMSGEVFKDEDNLKEKVLDVIYSFDREFFEQGFNNWVKRWEYVANHNGEYITNSNLDN